MIVLCDLVTFTPHVRGAIVLIQFFFSFTSLCSCTVRLLPRFHMSEVEQIDHDFQEFFFA